MKTEYDFGFGLVPAHQVHGGQGMIETQKLSLDQIYQLMRKEILRLEEECRMRKYRDKPDEYTDYAVEDLIERRRLHKEYDDSILREEQKKRELTEKINRAIKNE